MPFCIKKGTTVYFTICEVWIKINVVMMRKKLSGIH